MTDTLAELRALEAAATPGPWRHRDGTDRVTGLYWVDAPGAMIENPNGPDYPRQILEDDEYDEKGNDAALIATLRNNAGPLLDAWGALKQAHDIAEHLAKHEPDCIGWVGHDTPSGPWPVINEYRDDWAKILAALESKTDG